MIATAREDGDGRLFLESAMMIETRQLMTRSARRSLGLGMPLGRDPSALGTLAQQTDRVPPSCSGPKAVGHRHREFER
jgi:hypothetical protein